MWRCGDMTDVLVRDVPEDVIAALDSRASRLGLSRSEYLRRRLAQEAVSGPQPVTVEDLTVFAEEGVSILIPPDMTSRRRTSSTPRQFGSSHVQAGR